MEDIKDTNTEIVDSQSGDGTDDTGTTETKDDTETVTMSKVDYDKAIQSAEDRVRGKLSKQIRELEAKVKELSPVEKTQAEIDFEERIAKLEASEREVASQKRKLDIQKQLSSKGLDDALVDYIKDDIDIEALSTIIDGMAKTRVKNNGYIPGDHGSDESITPDEYKGLTYSQKKDFMEKHPEAYRRLRNKL